MVCSLGHNRSSHLLKGNQVIPHPLLCKTFHEEHVRNADICQSIGSSQFLLCIFIIIYEDVDDAFEVMRKRMVS
jgi:hypothetical protein